ncbi:MAG: biopolymer transporter ExbD [Opitutaceae bacterium]|nr:biopolymer transporter ExbD [Opitutaceae bacterium]
MSRGLYIKRRKRPEMNLVPLIDVLVMLIFFAFVTMQFRTATMLNLTLPKVETAGKGEFKGAVTISIDKEGAMTFNGKPATIAQMDKLLEAVKGIDKDTSVLLRSDENTPLKNVTEAMDLCRKRGLNKIRLQSR